MKFEEKFSREINAFLSGDCVNAYNFLGCHKSGDGYVFRVWAPHALEVYVTGDFNNWNATGIPMRKTEYGIWESGKVKALEYDNYKYYIKTPSGEYIYKTDPYAFHTCTRPENAGKVYDINRYNWTDKEYFKNKKKKNHLESPVNIYEMHLGSWRRHEDGNFFTYRESAKDVVKYVKEMGYTHIELLPVFEHPYDLSWGYQVTGYYAPTSRYGTPEDFAFFVDTCHNAGIGVILDWVGAHFPKDAYGLADFDGESCYEYEDILKREHPDWGTRIFDFGRGEVISFLVSNINFWQKVYHVDGFRVDAVASMLYLDYGKKDGQWRANIHGGNINLEAVEFLKKINSAAFSYDENAMMIAEESTIFPGVTKPPYDGGLGFLFKWNMGWMNDTLSYISSDPIYRKEKHDNITYTMTYAFSENYILPLSHDEVVHGKCSLINKMPGYYDDKFASLRTYYGYMMAHPGKKLLFMGSEFAQFIEWDPEKELDWLLLSYDNHKKMKKYVKELNKFYLEHSQMWELDVSDKGFKWISYDDAAQNVIAMRRINKKGEEIIVVCNFCPVERKDYKIGASDEGIYKCVFSSDSKKYGGYSRHKSKIKTKKIRMHGMENSLTLTLPPLSVMYYKKED